MIREFDIHLPEVCIRNGSSVSFESMTAEIQREARVLAIPVKIDRDTIKVNGVVKECLTLRHPQFEKEYMGYAITLAHQYNSAFCASFMYGESRELKKLDAGERAKAGFKNLGKKTWNGITNFDDSYGGMFKNAWGSFKGTVSFAKNLGAAFTSMGSNAAAREEELRWYDMLGNVIANIL